jgi:lipid A ethanolaminephosphotransferase
MMQILNKYTKSMFEGQGVRPGRNPTQLLVWISLWIAIVGNAALWLELHKIGRLHTGADIWVSLCMAVVMTAGLVALTVLLAWRRSIKPLAIFLLIAAALGAHFMLSYGIVIDDTMMVNVFQTDPRETRDLLNWRLALTVLVIAGLPTLWLLRQQVQHWGARKQLLRNLLVLLVACVLIVVALGLSFQGLSSLMRNHKHVRYLMNPLNSLYAIGQIVSKPLRHGP